MRASSFLVLPVHGQSSEHADKPHQLLRQQYRARVAGVGAPGGRRLRAAALALLGTVVGAGGTVFGVSYVQATDGPDMYVTMRSDRQRARPAQPSSLPVIAPTYVSRMPAMQYAPSRPPAANPLGQVSGNGTIIPLFNLNPFVPTGDSRATRGAAARKAEREQRFGVDVVAGASNSPRTICVRLCDGYQHPLGHLREASDLRGHAALCTAMFPGVPTAVYRVAAGADGIDDAVGPDGRTYRALPMAYAYQTSLDPVCAKPRVGAQTVSLLKDFTLRPGDSVVLNGRVRTFNGASSYPYTAANFSDFRRSETIGDATRRQIDDRVGVSRQERLQRQVRDQTRRREANAVDAMSATDVPRGGPSLDRSPVRVIDIHRR